MRKKILSIVAIAAIVLFSSCNSEELLTETNLGSNPEVGNTLSLKASMPGEDPSTRVGLEQEGKTISLTWEENDVLKLAFVQEGVSVVNSSVTLSAEDISPDGKNAQFDIIIPDGLNAGAFKLYGVYGGGDLSGTEVTLPTVLGNSSLDDVEARKDVMLYFETEIGSANSNASVMFKHLGSLFSITLENTGSTNLENLKEVRLVGDGGSSDWAYNSATRGQIYDLGNKEYQGVASANNYISFQSEEGSLAAGDAVTFWGWYPPLPDKVWPALNLELRDASDALYTTSVSLPARTAPTAVGRSFYFFAAWDGSDVAFTDGATFTIIDDVRDGVTFKVISGEINFDTQLTSNHKYILSGNVKVDPEVTLTIQEGTTIYAENGASLTISNKAKIMAEGTKEDPIVFTSINESPAQGQWGEKWVGININGLSEVSGVISNVVDRTSPYGGNNKYDNSGVMKYVRIEHAGTLWEDGALNLNGVGSNTIIENINIYESGRFGVTARGGTVNIKYLFIDNPYEKGFYWCTGYTGFVQHVAAIYRTSPRGAYTMFEGWDKESDSGTPASNPTFSNVTITTTDTPLNNSRGVRLREGALAKIYNALITNTQAGVRVENFNDTDIDNGDLVIANSVIWGNAPIQFHDNATKKLINETKFENSELPFDNLIGYIGVKTTGAKPANTIDPWFDDVDYIGAVPADNDWTAGWTK